ncbi:phosphoethanolamine transferase [Flavobacterium sp. WC2509]|uniref:phosphoethanolamine transferase n=1 Tax=Flavobacterium sp. WC2509 TaxID=3461406 RepID=UPI004044E0F4
MEAIKKYKKQLYFHFILNFYFGIFITFASFSHIPLNDFKDHIYYFSHFLAVQFSVFGFLYFLSLNRLVFTIAFPLLFVLYSIIAYWIYFQDIAISQSIIQVSIETKPDIILDLITIPFILYILCSIIACIIILKIYFKIGINQLKSPLILFAVIGIFTHTLFENYKYGSFNRRLPYNVVFSIKDYFNQNNIIFKPINKILKTNVDSLSVVFILGESVRADHLQLNAYSRKTNPFLSKRKNIISFPNTYTPLTYTAISVPQILTNATLTDDYSQPKYSLIDVLNHSNIMTNWIGNQTPEKSYETFIKQSNYSKIIDPLHSELSFQKDYDEKLLPIFKERYSPYKNQFTTIHMIGSHWWYETRYPNSFRVFNPVIKSKHIPSNSKMEMINSYDNTIVYLDYFINETIKHVEKYNSNTLIIYLSDHGETLGEDGLWLHAQKSKEIEHPAMLIWYSNRFKEKHSKMIAILKSNNSQEINLDFFFHSIVDLYKIKGIEYSKEKSILQD